MTDSLPAVLETATEANPQRLAVADSRLSMTYADLERQANRLAHLLRDLGVKKGDRVGVYLEKSCESLVGVYGAMKAGAAYVPLDPFSPAKRLAYIGRDCGIRTLLTGAEMAETWPALIAEGAAIDHLVVLNEPEGRLPGEISGPRGIGTASLLEMPDAPPTHPPGDGDLAYILYTSGSTGNPKGVMLTHRNALAFVEWAASELALTPEDRLSSHAPLHFDLSIFDLFAAARAGASLCLVPSEVALFPVQLAAWIDEQQISVWYSVPSALSMLVDRGRLEPGAFPRLRTVLFAGEVFPKKFLRRLMQLVPHARFYNLYGPTETNVCTFHAVRSSEVDDSSEIPIGKAISDVEVFAVTERDRVAAPGEVGELFVRGPSVMQGYWGDTERTARVLVSNPIDRASRDLVYRTGDLVRLERDGNYSFLGRRDAQIKSRGYRIELGEIESVLNAHPAVLESAVVAVPDELLTNRIKAFVVAGQKVPAGDLARFCVERIPRYMVPEEFEFLSRLPKTSTGKIDRQALRPQESSNPA
ncbi:MAG: amino acid adenylation domain-containing protein [Actinomycetota bacterium]